MCSAHHLFTLEDEAWLSWFYQDTANDDFDWLIGTGNTGAQGVCFMQPGGRIVAGYFDAAHKTIMNDFDLRPHRNWAEF